MTKMKILALAAVLSSAIAAPALAGDYYHRNSGWDRGDRGFGPAVAAGAVIGAAGAIATAPFRNGYAYQDSYAYDDSYDNGGNVYRRGYAQRNGFQCEPGTITRLEDGRPHLCQ